MYSYPQPFEIRHARGCIHLLGQKVAWYGQKVFIVTGKGSTKKTGLLDRVTRLLQESNLECVVFDEVEANPLTTTVEKGVAVLKDNGCDVVLGIGGGSAMDCAKAIAFAAKNEGDISDYIMGYRTGTEALPIVLVTTTAGTGSEGNSLAVLTNPENGDKKSLKAPCLYAKVAFVDPELMVTMPKKGIASCGFDAFTHCFEAYTSNRAGEVSQALALEGMKLLLTYLPKVYAHPDDVASWDKVSHANTLGGIAIDLAGVHLPHGLEHPISGLRNVSHGEGLAVLYPQILKTLKEEMLDRYEGLAEALLPEREVTLSASADKVIDLILNLREGLHLNLTLSDLGVTEADLEWCVQNAFKTMVYAISNQPMKMDSEALLQIYRQCL